MIFSTLRGRFLSLLVEEFESRIPQFKPYTLDYQMVVYACRDLETWLKDKWQIDDTKALFERIEEYIGEEHGQFRVFLRFWAEMWLEKWRERVQVLSSKPKNPPSHVEKMKRARKIYRDLNHRKDLKRMVARKLSCHREICMTDLIAENLIIEEIAKRMGDANIGPDHDNLVYLNPIDILNSVSSRISRISKDKGPLIYLNIKPYLL